jgi:hypothetical protein
MTRVVNWGLAALAVAALVVVGLAALIYFSFVSTVMSKTSSDGRHTAKLIRISGIDLNFKLIVDGQTVYNSPDFAPRPVDFREQIVWDAERPQVMLEVAGERLFGFDAASRKPLSPQELADMSATPFEELGFEGDLPGAESVHLFQFLRGEFAGFGINLPVASAPEPPSLRASVTRDDAGFIVTATKEAFSYSRSFLMSIFGAPKFDHDATSIFRDDARFTTVMLTEEGDETRVIVMHWKDEAVRNKIEEAAAAGMTKVVDDEMREVNELIERGEFEEVNRRVKEWESSFEAEDQDGAQAAE